MEARAFRAFDADNHYYEARDAFTRHADRAMVPRTFQWVEIDGRDRLLVGGRLQRFIANPGFDPIARPGCLDAYHRGETGFTEIREAFGELEPLPAAYQDRDARLAVMDEQGLEGAFLFPTLGVGMEEVLKDDIDALQHAFHAFNLWLHEDWGYAYRERIFAAPMISLSDPAAAAQELDLLLARDARVVCLRMAPVLTDRGHRSPGDPFFDGFWSRANEAGIVVAFHTGDSGYTRFTDEWEPFGTYRAFQFTPFRLMSVDRPVYDTMAALICHGVFERFPNLRVLSVENGASWVPSLFRSFEKVCKTHRHAFAADPIETFKRHVWVSPFQEDDVRGFVELLGADRVVLGSDFPHAEGLPDPWNFLGELTGLPEDTVRKVMRENTLSLSQCKPA